jgi:hypothetical protein
MVDEVPLLKLFLAHLISMSGGKRGLDASVQNERHVGCLLYQIDGTLSKVELLWSVKHLTILKTVL